MASAGSGSSLFWHLHLLWQNITRIVIRYTEQYIEKIAARGIHFHNAFRHAQARMAMAVLSVINW